MGKPSLVLLFVVLASLAVPSVSGAAPAEPPGDGLSALASATAISVPGGAVAWGLATPADGSMDDAISTDISIASTCTVSLTCDDGQVLQCSSSNGSCTAVNSNPPSECGYVQCDSTTQRCATYHQTVPGFSCCSGLQRQRWREQTSCDGTTWYTTAFSCSGICILQ